ncbi:MAG TPA: hypothetical protein PLA87_18180 [Pseudomonadota bacterium]|jgi:hypothetical protein|nr:hypothetical protein [Pseudomonadota bacterium]
MPRDFARVADRIWARVRPAVVEAFEAEVGGDEPSESADTLGANEEERIDEWLARKRQRDKQARQGKRGAKGKAT